MAAANDDSRSPVSRSAETQSAAWSSHVQNRRYMREFHEALSKMGVCDESPSSEARMHQRGAGDIGLTAPRCCHVLGVPPSFSLARNWRKGPLDPSGHLVDLSDRNLLCLSLAASPSTPSRVSTRALQAPPQRRGHASSREGLEVAVGCADHAVYTFDAGTGKRLRTLYSKTQGHGEWVSCVAHTCDGQILSGADDGRMCLWPRGGAVRCQEFSPGHAGPVSVIKTDAHRPIAISGGYDAAVRVWSTKAAPTEVVRFESHRAPIMALSYVGDAAGAVACSGDRSGNLILHDLAGGDAIRVLRHGSRVGHVTAVVHGDTGNGGSELGQVFFSGGQDGVVQIFDVRARQPVLRQTLHASRAGTGAVAEIVPCAHGVVTAGADKRICVMDPRQSFQPRAVFDDHADFIYCLTVIGDVCLSGAGNGLLLAHDLTQERLLWGLGASSKGAVRGVAATENSLVAIGDDGKALIYSFL